MTHRRVHAFVVLTLALAACGSQEPAGEDVRVVRTTTVVADGEATRADYSGEVRARYESVVGFRIGGRVAERLVQAGDRVRKGQALATLDAADAELNAGSTRAQLASLRGEYAQMQLDFERATRLYEQRFISQAEFDRDRVQLDSTGARLAAAQAQFQLANNQQAYTTLRAPWDGVVTAMHVEAGQVVAAGQAAASIAADGEREVAIAVPESRLEELREPGKLTVELWARPGRRYAARVREIAPMTDGATRQYTARISIVDPDDAIELGMTARVRLAMPRTSIAYRLPLTALYQKGGESYVWVVSRDSSRVEPRRVGVADVAEDGVVIAQGLAAGESVVTAGVNLLFEGQKVRHAEVRVAEGS
jgi:membrane fusion protein, multidrug efflux system